MQKLVLPCLVCVLFVLSSSAKDIGAIKTDNIDFGRNIDGSANNASNHFFANLTPGMRVLVEPMQEKISDYKWISKKSYQLGISDTFKIKGLVISTRNYIADERADIAPMDIVLGWKKMSDPAILKHITIRQNNRFYYWHVNEFPLARAELELNSTNIHLIPNNTIIESSLKNLKKGEIVELSGYLVDVKASDGFIWSTSRTRDDSGDGACEILLVKSVRRLHEQANN